jgi:hypothetical protein
MVYFNKQPSLGPGFMVKAFLNKASNSLIYWTKAAMSLTPLYRGPLIREFLAVFKQKSNQNTYRYL